MKDWQPNNEAIVTRGQHRDKVVYLREYLKHESSWLVRHDNDVLKIKAEFLRDPAEPYTSMTFTSLQSEVAEWSDRNFPGKEAVDPLLGAVEEIGELCHSFLKRKQGIRGTASEHIEAEKDAVADSIVYLADFCHQRGYDLQRIMEETWAIVKQRDWTKNKQDGS